MRYVACILLPFTAMALSSAHAATLLQLRSTPGDFIGQGIEWNFTPADGSLLITGSETVSATFTGPSTWSAYFAAPFGERLAVGNYELATRYPFQSPARPGLDVTGDGRGCNQSFGRFIVLEVQYAANGTTLQRIAIDFEQHCESPNAAPLYGALRYNSDVPLVREVPDAAAGPDQLVAEGAETTLDASLSSVGVGAISAYEWTQIDGPPVALVGANSASATFTAPTAPLGGADLLFRVQVTTTLGQVDTDDVHVQVPSKSDPQTFLFMDSPPGDYIGAGLVTLTTPLDALFEAARDGNGGVQVRVEDRGGWTLNFSPPRGGPSFGVGAYENAMRYPFHEDGRPGLSVSGHGRGCNTLSGRFDVLTFVVSPLDGAVQEFRARFEQSCEEFMPALHGEISIDARHPSVPRAEAGPDGIGRSLGSVTLDGSGSSDHDGSLVTYRWRQLSGPAASIADPSLPTTTIELPEQTGDTPVMLAFELLVTDDLGYMDADTVAVSVAPNRTPVAGDDSAETSQAQSAVISVLANDQDADGDLEQGSVTVANVTNGVAAVDASTGDITFTPAATFYGSTSFTYRVKDNEGAQSNAATVVINVNGRPVAGNDSASATSGDGVTVRLLDNDSDPDGNLNTASVVVTSQPANGTVTVSNGLATYTSSASFTGTDSFTYTVADERGLASAGATVTVNVTGSSSGSGGGGGGGSFGGWTALLLGLSSIFRNRGRQDKLLTAAVPAR